MEGFFIAFGINWKLLLIQAVNFGVLLTALTYFLYRPVMKIIDERRAKIDEGVRAAQAADQRLSDAKKEADGIVGDGAREAESLVATARTRAEEKGAQIVQDAETRAASVIKDADLRAAESRSRALRESEREIAKAAMLAAEKIMREKNA